MGVLTSFARVMYLKNFINARQAELQDITTEQLDLSNDIAMLTNGISELDKTDSAAVQQLRARSDELKALDAQLQNRLTLIQKQIQMATTELNSAEQMLQQNIQSTFSYGFGR